MTILEYEAVSPRRSMADRERHSAMAPIISLFNHKGGVSKTTTAFNLGWAMADRGKRVLIVDGDPQCNLTGTVLGFDGTNDFSEFYKKYPKANINNCLDPIFKATGSPLEAAMITKTINPNLFLLAGHIDLAENETQISVALSTSTAIPALQNIPGAIGELLRMTAEKYGMDVVIVDMSPSVGALNQCFLMGSDYSLCQRRQTTIATKRFLLWPECYPDGILEWRNSAMAVFFTHFQKSPQDSAA
jgi:chromosome partitioning protein